MHVVYVEWGSTHRWSPSLRGTATEPGQYTDFIDGLGPGQLVGRHVLGSSSLGDIQLSMSNQKGALEVEVIRARGLQVTNAPLLRVYSVTSSSPSPLHLSFAQYFFVFFTCCSYDKVPKYFQPHMLKSIYSAAKNVYRRQKRQRHAKP